MSQVLSDTKGAAAAIEFLLRNAVEVETYTRMLAILYNQIDEHELAKEAAAGGASP